MINAIFLVAWVVIICVALLTCLMIVKGIRIWLESRAFDKQAKSIKVDYLSQDLNRLTPEQFMKYYRGRLK